MIKKNLKNIKGFSHENFKIADSHIFKFSTDPKRFDFVRQQYEWLKYAKEHISTYAFDYIELIQDEFVCGYAMERIQNSEEINASDVENILEGIKNIKDSCHTDFTLLKTHFDTYRSYIRKIIIKNLDIFNFIDVEKYNECLMKYDSCANSHYSYCHGDLTTDNILKKDNRLIFIDSNYRPDLWQSYLLDIAKLYQETFFDAPLLFENIKNKAQRKFNLTQEEMNLIDLLHISHYIRMIPYVTKYPNIYKEKIKKLKELYKKQIK